jgi:COP9 signalosome complex subunit 4
LEDDDTVEAEIFVNKASGHMSAVPSENVALALRYRVTYARVLDANRKFVEAAMRYYDLSNTNTADVSVINLLFMLCSIVYSIINRIHTPNMT